MPIHLPVFQNPRPPIVGNIKVGGLGEVREGKHGPYRLPVKYDYFVITKRKRKPAERGEPRGDLLVDEELMTVMPKDTDGRVRRIPFFAWTDDTEEIFPTRLALYNGPRVQCSGDGIRATWNKTEEDGRTVQVERKCPCKYYKAKGKWSCKPHGTFYPEVQAGELTKTGAVHAFRTTGTVSINNIRTSLQFVRSTYGSIRPPLPLWMVVTMMEMDVEGVGVTTFPIVHVECVEKERVALMERMVAVARARHEVERVLGIEHIRMGLPAPASDEETPEEKAAIAEEFHPAEPENVIDAFYRESEKAGAEQPPPPDDDEPPEPRSRRDTKPDVHEDEAEPPASLPRGQRTRKDADHDSHADSLAGSFEAGSGEDVPLPAEVSTPEPEQSELRGEVGKMLQQVVLSQQPPIDPEKYARARTHFFNVSARAIYGDSAPGWKQATRAQLEAIQDRLELQLERLALQEGE